MRIIVILDIIYHNSHCIQYNNYFDENNCYIGYNDYYDKLYPTLGLNRNGKLDFNLDYEDHSKLSYVEYSLILKKAGRV